MIIASSAQDLDAATAASQPIAPQDGRVPGTPTNFPGTPHAAGAPNLPPTGAPDSAGPPNFPAAGAPHTAGPPNFPATEAPDATALHAATRLLAHERWQMATDVHDLIMQDLSLALANARALSNDPASASRAGVVVGALERALAGARDMLEGLSEHDTRPIALTIEASVRAAARCTPLRFDAAGVPSSAQPDRHTRSALVHIAREAVTNAVKHARPSTIEVVLEHVGQWRLTVHDDGEGFEEAPPAPLAVGGFGLVSMRESAHALGGAVHVGSTAGTGTTVEAVLP